jgi:hypothetical protein
MSKNATVQKAWSPAELDGFALERERLGLRLQNAMEALQKREDELAQVVVAEVNAHKVLNLTEGQLGYTDERSRAREVLEHCAQRRRELEPLIENHRRYVSEIKAELAKIPSRAISARDEVHKLARELSRSLP